MTTKQAKILDTKQLDRTRETMNRRSLTPARDRAALGLSHKGGLRAAEIAEMHIEDITDAEGRLLDTIQITSRGAKYGKARPVPMHPELRAALAELIHDHPTGTGPLFIDRFDKPMTANAMVQMLKRAYARAGLKGASSHSGRRTFITTTARKAAKVNCSLRDVQKLAGHASLRTTELYIEPSANVASLVALV